MRSSDLRSSRALLDWLRALTVAAGGLGGTACGWVPAQDTAVLQAPAQPLRAAEPRYGRGSTTLPRTSGEPRSVGSGELGPRECQRLCSARSRAPESCRLVELELGPPQGQAPASTTENEIAVLCEYHLPGYFQTFQSFGRRPLELRDFPAAPRTVAEHYERAAYGETAAILSFQQLAFDLEALGAPSSLVRAARRAARDEARHARASLALFRRFGGRELAPWPALPRARRRTPRLFEMALENATGGCVNETFGTWLQLHQARHAPEPEIRATARRIARDEARHAALAFELFDFFDRLLGAEERRHIQVAMHDDIRGLGVSGDLLPSLRRALGLPQGNEMRRAAEAIESVLPVV